ncbi:SNF2 family N-terminal domain-containing protein [Spinellus fusiger]|nr:SNF2 family N-terminal domain-containing protein [Spinellus fusiger]
MSSLLMNSTIPNLGSCNKCLQGEYDIHRLGVRCDVNTKRHLFHTHSTDSLRTILLRLCEEFPDEWSKETVYFFYMDLGGSYYTIDDSSWLRDKDQILVTTCEDIDLLPQISMNAVHASLRAEVSLRPHQEEGVQRMIEMEKTLRGGILADDASKTVQTLTLILRQQPRFAIKACTLVLVPSRGIADQWAQEIRKKTTYGSLPYFIYQEETAVLLEQPCFRLVIATYDRLRAEYSRSQTDSTASPLINNDWHRIVMDESHKVRTPSSMIAGAVMSLTAKYKWCVTGTPLQNNIHELYPIFHFLNVDVKAKLKNNHEYISRLLQKHMIRRTKASLEVALTILPRQERRVELEFSEPERALYDYLEQTLYRQLKHINSNGPRDHARNASCTLYLRLKQVCGHHQILIQKFPNLIAMTEKNQTERVTETLCDPQDEDYVRTYGAENEVETSVTFSTIESFYQQYGDTVAPPNMEALQRLPFIEHSTKMFWLINFLKTTLRASSIDKIVVVTQFIDLLHLIERTLDTNLIKYNSYHGEMSPVSRQASLRHFDYQNDMRVMLLSLKAGGEGLNLQRANHMVILDRWWNPDQAVARIHRMTQLKQTFIHTVIIKDTVEMDLMDNVLTKKNELFQTIVESQYDDEASGYFDMDMDA